MTNRSINNRLITGTVTGSDDPAWLGYCDGDGKIWTYVADSTEFHLNPAVHADYYSDVPGLEYRRIGVDEARHLVADGIGHISRERSRATLLAQPSMSVQAVLAKVASAQPSSGGDAPRGDDVVPTNRRSQRESREHSR